MDIRPDYANVEGPDGLTRVDPEEVAMGDVIVVKPGERVPLDGEVLEGRSLLDTSALTGESVPRQAAAGDTVISGCINQTGLLRVRVSRPYGESTVAKILELTENARDQKANGREFSPPNSPAITPPWWSSARRCWPCCRPSSWAAASRSGSTGRSSSWSSPAPARW